VVSLYENDLFPTEDRMYDEIGNTRLAAKFSAVYSDADLKFLSDSSRSANTFLKFLSEIAALYQLTVTRV